MSTPNRTVLVINRSDSRCGSCGKSALPDEITHDTSPGYGDRPPGCGALFTHVTSEYGYDAELRAEEMRPDLVPSHKDTLA